MLLMGQVPTVIGGIVVLRLSLGLAALSGGK